MLRAELIDSKTGQVMETWNTPALAAIGLFRTISEGPNMQCLMDHIVLNVEDDEKMITFYSDVLMFTPERLKEYRAGDAPFPSVRLNSDTIIDLFPKKLWQKNARTGQRRENLNHFCIALSKDTWETLLERLHTSNVDIEEGPVPRWGAHGTGTSIYFRDPERNLIEARYYEVVPTGRTA
ncbi:VOC family protein [Acidithiobacillus sp.]